MFSKQLILKAIEFMSSNSHNFLDNKIIELDLDNRDIVLTGSIHTPWKYYNVIIVTKFIDNTITKHQL